MNARKRTSLLYACLGAALLVYPYLVANRYVLRISDLAGLYMIVCVGLNLLAGYTGQLSIGHSAFFALGAYTTGLLNLRLGVPALATFPLAGFVAAVFGLVIGIPILRMRGPYLVMATVGFGEIVRIVLMEWSSFTRGTAGLLDIARPRIGSLVIGTERAFFYLIYATLVLLLFLTSRLLNSKVGRAWMAIRDRDLAAEAMGVPTSRYKTAAFGVSAFLAGLAGGIFASFQTYVSPDSFTFDDSVSFVSMIVVGGIGHLWGAIVGAGVLTAANEFLRAFKEYRLVIYGSILIVSIRFMPKGIAPVIESLVRRFIEGRGWPWLIRSSRSKGSASTSKVSRP